MANECSFSSNNRNNYDIGLKPFNHDKKRGKWECSTDFFYACLGHAFKIDAMMVLPSMVFKNLGVCLIIPYFVIMALCVVPIVMIQSFLGQFSSTGLISVFRIAPLFKGIGYVSLAINLTQLTYYTVFAAIPLFYFLHSLRPTMPWSCEGSKFWMDPNATVTTPCNIADLQDPPGTEVFMRVPSLEFFSQHMNIIHYLESKPPATFSWSLIVFTFFIWTIVGSIVSKPTEMIGRYIRYTCTAVLIIMGLCLLRFLFLPGALEGVSTFFRPKKPQDIKSWLFLGMLVLSTLGPGWGSILSMASYNRFKTNISKYSWFLGLAQFVVIASTAFLQILVTNHMNRSNPDLIRFRNDERQWLEFLSIPSALAFLELPNLWSMLYFAMLILGAMNLVVVQLFSVLTTLFDEYENLRAMKREVTWMTVGTLSLFSTYFCSNHGIMFFEVVTEFSVLTQMFLNLLLLFVILWVYGRERFQRDLRFMTGHMYATWMIYIVRFITPIFLIVGFVVGFIIAVVLDENYSKIVLYIVTSITILPWLLIPFVCIRMLRQSNEVKLSRRLRKLTTPTNWCPGDSVYRHQYELTFPNLETSLN
ncbi:sodium- and chloride-dependent glycine transporter 1-like [Eupeodes corollae]|uniref:sodium- and chloride-dependent glycine transporter 1-like n=1 Tax=Eupeodes corollae TaxID=290404 RepID=UPI0024901CC6|nr:sodium- and chloride-dependent glycine transporter 1-like [Eupeodes corollae]